MSDFYKGSFAKIADGLYLYHGAVNCGVLVREGAALLIDCCDSLTPDLLAEIGVKRVERVLLTQYRRPHSAGAALFANAGAEIVGPDAERELIQSPEGYWQDLNNRWGLIDYRPFHLTPVVPVVLSRYVKEGDIYDWRGVRFDIFATPGPTDGSVTYIFDLNDVRYAFCGGVIAKGGRIPEIYSMQVKEVVSCGYHGFFGARFQTLASVERLVGSGANYVVPSFGEIIEDMPFAAHEYRRKMDALMRNYTSVSAMRFYFPELFAAYADNPDAMAFSEREAPPPYVIRCGGVSFLIVSESGDALMLDCNREPNVAEAKRMLNEGVIRSIEHLFITHYHHDHIGAVPELVKEFGCDVWATEDQADVLRHPLKHFLPCILNVNMDAIALPHGKPFKWREFTLTAFNYPGQTLYADALLVEKGADKLFFVGDSFSPSGLDDYCAGNRNFLREGTGFLYCLDIIEQLPGVKLLNQHQDEMFSYSAAQIQHMRDTIRKRRALVEEITVQPYYEYALDEWWLRAYPFEQRMKPGQAAEVTLFATNHTDVLMKVTAEPVLPDGFAPVEAITATVPPLTNGLDHGDYPDSALTFRIAVPEGMAGRYIIPFRICVDGCYLGQFRNAILDASVET